MSPNRSATLPKLILPLISSVRRPPLANLTLGNLAQLVDLGRLARQDALRDLDNARDDILGHHRVRGADGLDADHADARVVLAAVVLAVSQVAQPRLESRAVVLLDELAVRLDCGGA